MDGFIEKLRRYSESRRGGVGGQGVIGIGRVEFEAFEDGGLGAGAGGADDDAVGFDGDDAFIVVAEGEEGDDAEDETPVERAVVVMPAVNFEAQKEEVLENAGAAIVPFGFDDLGAVGEDAKALVFAAKGDVGVGRSGGDGAVEDGDGGGGEVAFLGFADIHSDDVGVVSGDVGVKEMDDGGVDGLAGEGEIAAGFVVGDAGGRGDVRGRGRGGAGGQEKRQREEGGQLKAGRLVAWVWHGRSEVTGWLFGRGG